MRTTTALTPEAIYDYLTSLGTDTSEAIGRTVGKGIAASAVVSLAIGDGEAVHLVHKVIDFRTEDEAKQFINWLSQGGYIPKKAQSN